VENIFLIIGIDYVPLPYLVRGKHFGFLQIIHDEKKWRELYFFYIFIVWRKKNCHLDFRKHIFHRDWSPYKICFMASIVVL